MSRVVPEHSTEDYRRKFAGTIAVCDDGKQYTIYTLDGEVIFDKDGGDPIRASPVYHHFAPRYYKFGTRWAYILRKNKKSFKVGISPENYNAYYHNPDRNNWVGPSVDAIWRSDYLSPLVINKEEALKTHGPLNDHFFVDKKYVYCKVWAVALRKGNVIEVLNTDIKQEIQDAFRDTPCLVR